MELQKKYKYENLRILGVPKSAEWKFQLANIVWHAYSESSYDRILSFDVDTVLTKNVMLGLPDIGRNGIAVISFTKRLLIRNISDLVRYYFYRQVVRHQDTFAGIYWVYRPYFFDTINPDKYRAIVNGVDNILVTEVIRQNKYRLVTRKEIGVKCLTPQNNDYPWRQFETGVWFGAHQDEWHLRLVQQDIVNSTSGRYRKYLFRLRGGIRNRTIFPLVKLGYFRKQPVKMEVAMYVYVSAFEKQHPYLLKGYRFALENPESEIVRVAASMDEIEWGYVSSRYLNKLDWKFKGTGFEDS